jgi:hypothetical protein|eukprot:scaffold608337_cov130-Attheya_sp.AAC.1
MHNGFLADGPAVQDILNGTYIPPSMTEKYAQEFIKELKISYDIRNKGTLDGSYTGRKSNGMAISEGKNR